MSAEDETVAEKLVPRRSAVEQGGLNAESVWRFISKYVNHIKEDTMAQASKNSRTSIATQKFFCSCGGEIKMKTLFEQGKVKNVAECEKCKRLERRPSDFK